MDAVAQSPPVRYSTGWTCHSSTHPEPVAVLTTITARSKAPVRRSSSTTTAAREARSWGSWGMPAYTRIGSSAGRPVTASMSLRRGPRPRKTRPCPPTDSQELRESGEPERSGSWGW